MPTIPTRLSRRAVKSIFVKLKPETWNYHFDVETRNGLHEHRVKGPNGNAFYNADGVMTWLCEMGYYTPADFNTSQQHPALGQWSGLHVRTHSLAG